MWVLWLLSQPPERGGPGFDPITARKLTLEAALFYLTSEAHMKTRCMHENAGGDMEGFKEGLREKLKVEKERLRKFYTGSDELK